MKLGPYWLLALSFIGLGDTFYLSYYQFLNLIPACAIGGCERVLTSAYSHFLSVPLSYFGLIYYAYMLCLGILLAIDPDSKGLRFGALLYAGIGLACSLVFELYIQAYLIGALCMYCGISAITTLLLFTVAYWHFRSARNAQ